MLSEKYLDRKANEIYEKYNFGPKDIHPFEYDNKIFEEEIPEIEFIKCGGSRIVYKMDNKVIKFAMNGPYKKSKGNIQNKNEFKIWEKADASQREVLSRVIDISQDNKWIITPYYENILGSLSNNERNRKDFKKYFENYNIKFEDGFLSNIAIVEENKYIIVDYGYKVKLL